MITKSRLVQLLIKDKKISKWIHWLTLIQIKKKYIVSLLFPLLICSQESEDFILKTISLKNITINDSFWSPKLEIYRTNTILHGISLDGKSFYYRNPELDKNPPRGNNWCCCPPGLSRTLMKLGQYIYAYDENTIYLNLFVGSQVEIPLNNNHINITQQTQYPWNGYTKIEINPDYNKKFTLKIRKSFFMKNLEIRLNNHIIKNQTLQDGFISINRKWAPHDSIAIYFKMPVIRMKAHPNILMVDQNF